MYCLKGGGVLLEKIDGNYSSRYRTTLGSTGGERFNGRSKSSIAVQQQKVKIKIKVGALILLNKPRFRPEQM